MKKNLLLVVGMLCSVLSTIAQAPIEKTLLWEVSGPGIKKPSFLYGTIHLICPQDLSVAPLVKEKFNSTKALYLEIKMDDPNMMAEMMKGMKMTDTSTLKQLIGEQAFDSAGTIFKNKTGIPLQMLNTAKPMLVSAMIYPSLLGCQPDSWEKTFEKMAKENTMPLFGLEKLSDQMAVFEKIPYHVQADMLVKMLYNLDSSKKTILDMLDVYKNKDVAKMYEITTADEDFGEYEGILLTERNKNWIPVIKEQAKKMPTFFACGAGHLGGKDGVISLLRKEGYKVKPLLY